MNKKLTLTIDERIVKEAKKYASRKNRSLSGLIENYLRAIIRENIKTEIEISPITKSLQGSFKAPKELDYKKELSKALSEKYH